MCPGVTKVPGAHGPEPVRCLKVQSEWGKDMRIVCDRGVQASAVAAVIVGAGASATYSAFPTSTIAVVAAWAVATVVALVGAIRESRAGGDTDS